MMNTLEIKKAVLENACLSLGYEKKYISEMEVSYVKKGYKVFVDFYESANIYDPVYSFRVHYNSPCSYSNLLFNILKNSTDKDDYKNEIESLFLLVDRYKKMFISYV